MFDRSGFGYITFPVLAKLTPSLEKQDYLVWDKIIKDVIKAIESAPKHTKRMSFLKFSAVHLKKSNATKQNLETLLGKLNSLTLKQITAEFNDIVYSYVGYLDKNESKRTLSIMEKCFNKLEAELSPQNIEGLSPKNT